LVEVDVEVTQANNETKILAFASEVASPADH